MFPKVIEIGDFFIPTYGVLVAVGFIAGITLVSRLARRAGLNGETVANLGIYCIVAALLGAKLFMIVFDWREYAADPGKIFTLETLQAGGVFHGGLIVALIVAFLYMRAKSLPALLTADVFAPGIALGHAIGRLGCFAAGCCWGERCDLPWSVTFTDPDAYELTGVPLDVALHPTQLYEAGAEAVIFAILMWRIRRAHVRGQIIGLYLILYSVARFAVEFVRYHEQPLQSGISLTQWLALALLALGIWLYFRGKRLTATVLPQSR